MADMDDKIEAFTGFTGASPAVARHYLQLSDNDAQQAIQLFFDAPELASTMPSEPSPAAPARRTTSQSRGASVGREDSSGVVHIDSDSDEEEDVEMDFGQDDDDVAAGQHPTNATAGHGAAYEDDEAMARRLQQEMYAGGDMGGGIDADGVRAPIARTTETLVGPNADWTADDMHEAVLQQMNSRNRSTRPGLFNQRIHASGSSIWDESNPTAQRQGLSEATGGASETSTKAAKLAELFRPPFELITRMPWDDARDKGKEEEKWIIVNVQDPSIFDCQILNRDIWKNEGIKETVKENFIFMQYAKDDPRGMQYMQYYFPLRDSAAAYPHIAIVDPRTGEQVKVWSGPPVPKAMDFLMQLHEFLDRYSLKVTAKNPVARRKPEKTAVDVDKLTEEQMLDLALQNSLANGNGTGPKPDDPDDLTKSISDVRDDGKGKGKEVESPDDITDTNGGSHALPSSFEQISSTVPHEEPANDPTTTTRIQFRHANGRIIRRFNLSDPVRRIYEWQKAEPLEGKQGVEFELRSMGKDLMESIDETIGDAGLRNGTVMIEYIED